MCAGKIKRSQFHSYHKIEELLERVKSEPTGQVLAKTWFDGCTPNDGLQGTASEGEGACLPVHAKRSHLPLRGKLGWMTPRPGVKTTPGMECALRGSRSQAGAPL